jgi:hypothetical protein
MQAGVRTNAAKPRIAPVAASAITKALRRLVKFIHTRTKGSQVLSLLAVFYLAPPDRRSLWQTNGEVIICLQNIRT